MTVEMRRVCFAYTPGKPVLDTLDYISTPQSISVLAGVNGCGKSTMLKLLAGAVEPLSGEILIDGVPLNRIPRKQRSQKIAYLPQNPVIPEGFTVEELLCCSRYAINSNGADNRAAIAEAMADTGISDLAGRQLTELSGGEKQRAFLAFTLARNSDILLLDEPFSAIDPAAFRELFTLLAELKKRRKLTVIMVLHDINRALHYGDRIIGLKHGSIRFDLPVPLAAREIPQLYDLPDGAVVDCQNGNKFFL